MIAAKYLADTSAVARFLTRGADRYGWTELLQSGVVGLCDLTELEIGFSARSSADREALLGALSGYYAWCAVPDGAHRRAREVQHELTRSGQHRSAGPVDLVVAATAELLGLTLVHCDRDFEVIAAVSGQPTHMIGP
ncbi:PIN domain nuclease [Streptomyces endophytica]|uniref:Ribonuclease VapC n=1 Tax=Streptomyces endophytica TaxID=2991496 RepID=A0ABY6PDN6_9ACTN|nr:PIN domain nuclease [Streptomyces endophytica]UZJ31964.1 PIN domain nuclease [Streptomyces endophytica]